MNISAINCTPIKPQVSFKGQAALAQRQRLPLLLVDNTQPQTLPAVVDQPQIEEYPEVRKLLDMIEAEQTGAESQTDTLMLVDKQQEEYDKGQQQMEKVKGFSNKLYTTFVEADDVKKPVAAAAAIVSAAGLAFTGAFGITALVTKVPVVKAVPEILFNNLKKGSGFIQKSAANLINNDPGKINKVKDIAGKALNKANDTAKRLAKVGVSENASVQSKAARVMCNIAGYTGVATIFPRLMAKDADGDGVSDILQKSQNVYTGVKKDMSSAFTTASKLAELASILA